MSTNWRTVAAIVGVFWVGNFLTIGFHDYANASEQTRKALGQLSQAQVKISSSAVDCQLQTNGLINEIGAQKAQNSAIEIENLRLLAKSYGYDLVKR